MEDALFSLGGSKLEFPRIDYIAHANARLTWEPVEIVPHYAQGESDTREMSPHICVPFSCQALRDSSIIFLVKKNFMKLWNFRILITNLTEGTSINYIMLFFGNEIKKLTNPYGERGGGVSKFSHVRFLFNILKI